MAHDLTRLSHADLEDLAMDLLQAKWGVTLECFRTGRDDGIDLRHSSCQGGTTIVQCKHYAGSGLRTLLSHLRRQERPKVLALAPSRYVLVTSVPVSPRNKASIVAALAPTPIVEADGIGADEIEALLRRFPTVEKAHLKLWLTSAAVLERVLHNAEQVQTDFQVEKVREKISLYVRSPSYDAALGILERERVVVISGPPGIGKSTLADLLLFAHLERGYQPVVVRRGIAEAKRLFNRTARQVFYFDDFLGETFLGDRSDFLGRREDAEITDFMEMVARSRSSRFVLATRDHLLNSAYGLSERFGREKRLFEARRCVLDVKGYGSLVRARILYNHIHFSNLPPRLKKALVADTFYLRVLRHGNFNPRLVEWLCTPRNVCGATPTSYRATVLRVLDEPEMVWRGAFKGSCPNLREACSSRSTP